MHAVILYRRLILPPDADLSPKNERHELFKYVYSGRFRQCFQSHEDLHKSIYGLANIERGENGRVSYVSSRGEVC